MPGIWITEGVAPYILNLDTTWRWVDSFTPGRFVLGEGGPLTMLDRRLCGPQSRPGHFRNEQFPYPCRT